MRQARLIGRGNVLMGKNSSKGRTNDLTVSGKLLRRLGLKAENAGAFCGEWLGSGKLLKSISPINGQVLASVRMATAQEYERTTARAEAAFQKWQAIPAPKRGELVRQLGNALREAKHDLGRLVSLEA